MKKIITAVAILLIQFLGIARAEEWNGPAWYEDDFFAEEEAEDVAHNVGEVMMEGTLLADDLLRIKVQIKDLRTPVIGTSFWLKYDPELAKFLGYTPGSFFEQGGDPFYMLDESDQGVLIVGETLRRSDSFPMGDGEIMYLDFEIQKDNDLAFEFERGVFSTVDAVRQDLSHVTWQNLYITKEKHGEIVLNQSPPSILSIQDQKTIEINWKPWIYGSLVFLTIVTFSLAIYGIKHKSRPDRGHLSYVNFK